MSKHKNYDALNLLGYALAKFDMAFVKSFGFKTKTDFYKQMVQLGVADTVGTVKNRQDLFDPFFENGRRGWWQKGEAYIHRKIHIDSLFGNLDANAFAKMLDFHLRERFGAPAHEAGISPLAKTKFKQLQLTGQEAEWYFMENYQKCESFQNGALEDARMFGDGYDFQIEVGKHFYLAEIKGVRAAAGAIRMTEKEYKTAREYKNDYALVVVANLAEVPRMHVAFNPASALQFTRKTGNLRRVEYHTGRVTWR